MFLCCGVGGGHTRTPANSLPPPPEMSAYAQITHHLWSDPAEVVEPLHPDKHAPGTHSELVKAAAARPKRHFIAKLHGDGSSDLTGALDMARGSLLRVCSVDIAAIMGYNKTAPKDERIEVGDFVMSVQGVESTAPKAAELLRRAGDVELEVRCPSFVQIRLEKRGLPLGLDLSFHMSSTSLVVAKVCDKGAVAVRNKDVEVEERIRVGDFIISANGEFGSAIKMQAEILRSETLELEVCRPSVL